MCGDPMAAVTKIKRVKGGVTLYAAEFAKSGTGLISLWTAEESKAHNFDAKESAAVAEFYKSRSNVGVMTFEPGGKPINDASKATAEEKAHAAKLEAERKAESQRIEVLIGKADRCDELECEVRKLNERCASLTKEVASLKAENDFLEKEIAETAAKAKAASEAKEQSKVEPAKAEPAKAESAKTATPAPVHHQGKAKA